MNDLIKTIENLREILCFLVVNKELTDVEVVLCSQELDKLLIEYMRKNYKNFIS
ncbi:hypothetical protein CPJCM30710_10400 [Clostridium polyendosporum]|uniref:Spo0E like sporulation regulatory protein n=1 Tax=Clostridium polyendosporum TaxID=69208 RepID=A0A919RY25_9CLOT|nr:aspartyl-phosphate phosphatase Spo0E family protein [Clostridium polyendosporum]GIM28374.1 hypothetical protein CPJCM30710_10400 [Clostridium polyendosporum]